MVSNTLILTGFTDKQLEDQVLIRSLQQVLVQQLPTTTTAQFIILKSFHRILLIFETRAWSLLLSKMYKTIGLTEGFSCGFATNDHDNKIDNYLQLPSNAKMFLISPPPSPPVEFNYNAEEEEPNKLQIYTHEDIKELFLRNNEELRQLVESGGHQNDQGTNTGSNTIKDLGREVVLNDSKHGPKIILHPIDGHDDHLIGKAIDHFRTHLPPRSVFDAMDDDT